MTMENENLSLQTMFNEAKNQLERQYKSSATLRDHAKTLISVASVVVSFFSTFKIGANDTIKSHIPIALLFLGIAAAYLILMILAIKAANPTSLESPINPRMDDYIEAYSDKDERVILSNQIVLYLRAIEKNEKVIFNQYTLLLLVDILLAVVVVLIVVSTIISVIL